LPGLAVGVGRRQDDFENIVAPHTASLLRFARRLCQASAEAEDLVQEALMRAWGSFHQLRADSNSRAWLFRILLNCWYSEGRRRSARITPASLEEAGGLCRGDLQEAVEINQALAMLPHTQRAVLLLAAVEGFTCREMAEMLSIPPGTVMSRLSRARAAMRELAGLEKQTEAGMR